MIDLEKIIGKVPVPPPPLRRPAPAPYVHLLFKIFLIPPSGEGGRGPNYV